LAAEPGTQAAQRSLVIVTETIRAGDENADGLERAPAGSARGAELSVDAILEEIGEGFFALGRDWRFTAFNRAAGEIRATLSAGHGRARPAGVRDPFGPASRSLP
jgi:hypothetical protein